MVRNYDQPDPSRVVSNIARVLQEQDMRLLSKDAYEFLVTHCDFSAHYDRKGFVVTYQDSLPYFINQFLSQRGWGWNEYLDNPQGRLYDVSYKGKLLADIIRELIPLFEKAQESEWIAYDPPEEG